MARRATADEIRAFLFGRLAEFKIPSRLIIVDEIPAGATGKIRRIGLETEVGRATPAVLRGAAGCDRERRWLRCSPKCWRVETVGAFDNFFALGGDSLRGFQVLTRIRAQWQVDVSILDLFKEPTVAQLAAALAAPDSSRTSDAGANPQRGGAFPMQKPVVSCKVTKCRVSPCRRPRGDPEWEGLYSGAQSRVPC